MPDNDWRHMVKKTEYYKLQIITYTDKWQIMTDEKLWLMTYNWQMTANERWHMTDYDIYYHMTDDRGWQMTDYDKWEIMKEYI